MKVSLPAENEARGLQFSGSGGLDRCRGASERYRGRCAWWLGARVLPRETTGSAGVDMHLWAVLWSWSSTAQLTEAPSPESEGSFCKE